MIAYASSRPPTKVSHQEETYIVVFSLISEASDLIGSDLLCLF